MELIDKQVKNTLINIFTENISKKIILCSITKNDIIVKNFVGEKIVKYMKSYGDKYDVKYTEYLEKLSLNSNITPYIIEKHPEMTWDLHKFSSNPNLTMEFVKKYPFGRDWRNISSNSNLTIEFIVENPDINWDWYFMSGNKNITQEFIEKHVNEKLNVQK